SQGVGRQLLARLLEVAGREGISRVHAEILEPNLRMQRLCSSLGFALGAAAGGVVDAEITISA
ncbi:MAG TPA: GNAT family N-acetyltransferase, partial [Polyangia bacterium]|nr:GNAT family N-acetyltransferase [Polyangia bacterium]